MASCEKLKALLPLAQEPPKKVQEKNPYIPLIRERLSIFSAGGGGEGLKQVSK